MHSFHFLLSVKSENDGPSITPFQLSSVGGDVDGATHNDQRMIEMRTTNEVPCG